MGATSGLQNTSTVYERKQDIQMSRLLNDSSSYLQIEVASHAQNLPLENMRYREQPVEPVSGYSEKFATIDHEMMASEQLPKMLSPQTTMREVQPILGGLNSDKAHLMTLSRAIFETRACDKTQPRQRAASSTATSALKAYKTQRQVFTRNARAIIA